MNEICKYCNKEFHRFSGANVRITHIEACYLNPNNIAHCECCGDLITRMGKRNPKDLRKYCNHSCAATEGNKGRKVTWNDKIRNGMNEYFDNHPDFRNYDELENYKTFMRAVHRKTRHTIKDDVDLYNKWQSNPYTGGKDTTKMTIDHKKSIKKCYLEGLSVEETSDVSNLQVISHRENGQKGWT